MEAIKIVILFAFSISFSLAQTSMDYSELVQMGVSCPDFDSCKMPRKAESDTIPEKSCQCGEMCTKFGTCCIDSRYFNFNNPPVSSAQSTGSCEKVHHSNISAYIVSRCNPSWRGSSLTRSQCESSSTSLKDPIGVAPVTSTRSQTTYKNYFCASCNNDADALEMWKIGVNYQGEEIPWGNDKESILKDLKYDAKSNTWEITRTEQNGEIEYYPTKIQFSPPSKLHKIVRPCVKDMISQCHDAWTLQVTRRKCAAYMAIVYIQEEPNAETYIYRNIHCAICNFESFDGLNVCKPESDKTGLAKPPLSFTLLLDVNLSDGNKVGEVNPCKKKGEVYDSFFKKCRTLSCGLPGYVLKGDKCAPA